MNGIFPPKRPTPAPQPASTDTPEPPPSGVEPVQSPLLLEEHVPLEQIKKRPFFKKIGRVVGVVAVLLVVAVMAGILWYQQALSPVSGDKNAVKVSVMIETGMTPSQIADLLSEKKLIHSAFAFNIYTRLSDTQNQLQAGLYRLSPAESTQAIVDHLVSGKTDEFNITFLPGATLAENKEVLIKAGYSQAEVDAAFKKTYDSPLFQNKPVSADLEGYIFGETYRIAASDTVEQVLERAFAEFYANIQKDDLIAGFKAHHLNLYQGITLASIIQREVSRESDETQVAQVFYKRLREGTVLGSDVTYKYAAKRFNLVDSPDQDSAYNTRKVKGLPPGPIAVPGIGALRAVAHPASGDFEFFLAGDDGKTYFAYISEQHEQNIRDHCQINCAE